TEPSSAHGPLLPGLRRKLKLVGTRNGHVEVVSAGTKLRQRESLRVRRNPVHAIFGNDHVVIADMKPDHRMIPAVAGADAGDDDTIATRAQIELFEYRFHLGLVETIMRSFLH